MRKRSFILFMTLILGLPWMTMAQTRYSGSGTESDPYLIQSVSDWDSFADAVKNGTPYAGTYFKLMHCCPVKTGQEFFEIIEN